MSFHHRSFIELDPTHVSNRLKALIRFSQIDDAHVFRNLKDLPWQESYTSPEDLELVFMDYEYNQTPISPRHEYRIESRCCRYFFSLITHRSQYPNYVDTDGLYFSLHNDSNNRYISVSPITKYDFIGSTCYSQTADIGEAHLRELKALWILLFCLTGSYEPWAKKLILGEIRPDHWTFPHHLQRHQYVQQLSSPEMAYAIRRAFMAEYPDPLMWPKNWREIAPKIYYPNLQHWAGPKAPKITEGELNILFSQVAATMEQSGSVEVVYD